MAPAQDQFIYIIFSLIPQICVEMSLCSKLCSKDITISFPCSLLPRANHSQELEMQHSCGCYQSSIWQVKKLKKREVKEFAQGHEGHKTSIDREQMRKGKEGSWQEETGACGQGTPFWEGDKLHSKTKRWRWRERHQRVSWERRKYKVHMRINLDGMTGTLAASVDQEEEDVE